MIVGTLLAVIANDFWFAILIDFRDLFVTLALFLFSPSLSLGCVCRCPRPLAGVVSESRGACVIGHVPCFPFFPFSLSLLGVRVLVSTSLDLGGVLVRGCVRHWPFRLFSFFPLPSLSFWGACAGVHVP